MRTRRSYPLSAAHGRRLAWLASAAAAIALPAFAQEAEGQTPKAPVEVEGVVVSGQAAQVRTTIDRKSYAVGNDIAAATGSASDVLRNVPAVEVDAQGAISLRGDPNVIIMVDGVRVGGGQGSGSDPTSQIPGDQVERVEVITNPSAALGPEGSGGVINIITKKGKGAGASRSLRGQFGTGDRYVVGASANYNTAKLGVTTDINRRRVREVYFYDLDRTVTNPLTGVATASDSQLNGIGNFLNNSGRVSLDYDLTAADRLNVQARVNEFKAKNDHSGYLAGPGAVSWEQHGDYRFRTVAGSSEWLRKFSGDDHTLSARLSLEDQKEDDFYRRYETPPKVGLFIIDRNQEVVEGRLEYKRPFAGGGRLTAGLQIEDRAARFADALRFGVDEDAARAAPKIRSAFTFDQQVQGAYATYQRPGTWTVLAGLRIEDVRISVEDRLGFGGRTDQSYFEPFPSLHLSRDLDEGEKLTLSYSRRIVRPQPWQFNPIRLSNDPTVGFEGDPGLRPEFINAFEAGFERRRGRSTYMATLYLRQGKDGVTEVFYLDGDAIILRQENLGERTTAGLELVVNRPITPKLSMNVSANLAYVEIESEVFGTAYTRDAFVVGGRGSFDWQPTAKDTVQLNLIANARRPTPQGYRAGRRQVNLGYRRKVNDRLNLTVTVQDVLDDTLFKDVVEGPVLNARSDRFVEQRAAFIGFSYALGGAAKKEEFDFGGQ